MYSGTPVVVVVIPGLPPFPPDARHRDRGGRRWRRWATAAQWAAGRQRQDGRAAAAGQGDGVSPSYLLDFNERDIPHTTGIHK